MVLIQVRPRVFKLWHPLVAKLRLARKKRQRRVRRAQREILARPLPAHSNWLLGLVWCLLLRWLRIQGLIPRANLLRSE